MSDSEHSTVTYTSISFPVEDDSDIGSPGSRWTTHYARGPYAYIMMLMGFHHSNDTYLASSECSLEYMPQEDEIHSPRRTVLESRGGFQLTTTADREDDVDEGQGREEGKEEEEEHQALADLWPPVHRKDLPGYLSGMSHPYHFLLGKSCLPLRKRVRFASPTHSHEVGESSAAGAARQDGPTVAKEDPYSIARGDLYGFVDMVEVAPGHPMVDYGITDTWDDLVGAIDEIAPTTLEGVNQRVTDLSTIVEQETTIMYAVMIEREAKMAREAWGLSMDASDYARSDVMSLRTTVVAQSALISELQSADHRRQRVISELLASDHKRQVQLTKTLRLLKDTGPLDGRVYKGRMDLKRSGATPDALG
ncbi:hypothetical protein Tco_0277145 [Tanacetum coccineum]